MSVLLRLCFSLVLLTPALVHAATLENPANGSFYSGIGVISGWKCTATGPLTVRFNDGAPLPLAYGNARADVRNAGACRSTQVGFVSIMNWANLGDGEHTAVVYDNGVEFARSTFTVATTGESYVTGAEGECRVPDFPALGETMPFAWNEATQHLEMVNQRGGSGSGGEDAPGVPRNVRVTEVGEELVVVEWDPPTGGGAVSYNLYYRSPNGPEESLGNMSTLGSRVSGPVVPGECYRVTAVNAAGVEGEKSPEVCVWPQQSPDGGGGGGGPAALENPATGSFYSGLGVISGWKCEATGPLTVRFNNGAPLPLAYGNARADVRNAGACPSAQVGFVSIMNWAELGDGEHTAVVYDDGVEFARSTFTVATTGEPFVTGAEGECRVPDFPAPGETMPFAWNEATQHLEMIGDSGGTDDHGGTEEDATAIGQNQVIKGVLTRGDRDVFRVREPKYGHLRVGWAPDTWGGPDTARDARLRKLEISVRDGESWSPWRLQDDIPGHIRAGGVFLQPILQVVNRGGPLREWLISFSCGREECAGEYYIGSFVYRSPQIRHRNGDPTVWMERCTGPHTSPAEKYGTVEERPPACAANAFQACVTKLGDGTVIQDCPRVREARCIEVATAATCRRWCRRGNSWACETGGNGDGDDDGGGSDDGGSGGGLCGQNPHDVCTDIWTGDPADVQSASLCQSACAYATQCHDEGVRINCANLRRLDELNNTDYGIRNCSVCQ